MLYCGLGSNVTRDKTDHTTKQRSKRVFFTDSAGAYDGLTMSDVGLRSTYSGIEYGGTSSARNNGEQQGNIFKVMLEFIVTEFTNMMHHSRKKGNMCG